MTAGTMLKTALRSIFRNRMRSLLTSLGIIIGVGSVIIMVGVGAGSQAEIQEQIQSMGSNLIMVFPERHSDAANRLTLEDKEKVKKEAGYLKAVSGSVRKGVTAVGGDINWSTTLEGVEPDYLIIKEWTVESGAFFTEKDGAARRKVAVLGSTVAEEIYGSDDPVGQKLRIDRTPFTVIGVLESKGNTGMGNDQDDTILIPLETALYRLSGNRYLQGIQMSALSRDVMDAAQAEIEAILKEAHRLSQDEDADFRVINQSEIIEMASSTSRTLTILLAAIASVSLLVGGIGIMNIMLVSVTERTREIGIRMSVGARKNDILFQFLIESILLSLIGGAIGIVFAGVTIFILNRFTGVAALLQPGIVIISALFAAAVGIFFGYYPARKASKLYPIDALRYE